MKIQGKVVTSTVDVDGVLDSLSLEYYIYCVVVERNIFSDILFGLFSSKIFSTKIYLLHKKTPKLTKDIKQQDKQLPDPNGPLFSNIPAETIMPMIHTVSSSQSSQ